MPYRRFDINGRDTDTLYTELLYAIAVAKTEGASLLRLVLFCEEEINGERLALAEGKHLRRLKREGRIRLFVYADAIGEDTTEAAYLLNKYPTLAEEGRVSEALTDAYIIV